MYVIIAFIVVHLPFMCIQVRIWIILLISFEACVYRRLELTITVHTGADTMCTQIVMGTPPLGSAHIYLMPLDAVRILRRTLALTTG